MKYILELIKFASSKTEDQETGGIERLHSFLSLLNVTYLNLFKGNTGMYEFKFKKCLFNFICSTDHYFWQLTRKCNNEIRSQESIKVLVVSAWRLRGTETAKVPLDLPGNLSEVYLKNRRSQFIFSVFAVALKAHLIARSDELWNLPVVSLQTMWNGVDFGISFEAAAGVKA